MDINNLSAINHDSYHILLMLIQGLTLVFGLASAMFVVVSVICAACDFFGETRQSGRRRLKQAPETRAYEPLGRPSSLEYALDHRTQSGVTSSIQ